MTETILSIFSIYGAPALFVIVAAGQFGIPLPTSILLLTAGALQAKLGQVRDTGLFRYVEPDFYRSINRVTDDTAFTDGTLWGLNNQGQNGGTDGADIDAPEAWDITVGSRNTIVAVVDTGVRYTHQDLANQMWVNEDEVPNNGLDDDLDGFVDNIYGADIIGNDGDPMDGNGHGSHVAGTIGAEAGNGHPHVGVAWDVRLMAIKVFGASGQGSMAAILGLEDQQIIDLCAAASQGEVVSAVNFNAPGQVVIAGQVAAVERAIEGCKAAGAKRALPLPVSVPSHCALMQPAAEQLADDFAALTWQAPEITLVQNVTARPAADQAALRQLLVEQLYSPVRWVESVVYMADQGVTDLVECGPGKVLGGLNKRCAKGVNNHSLESAAGFEACRAQFA